MLAFTSFLWSNYFCCKNKIVHLYVLGLKHRDSPQATLPDIYIRSFYYSSTETINKKVSQNQLWNRAKGKKGQWWKLNWFMCQHNSMAVDDSRCSDIQTQWATGFLSVCGGMRRLSVSSSSHLSTQQMPLCFADDIFLFVCLSIEANMADNFAKWHRLMPLANTLSCNFVWTESSPFLCCNRWEGNKVSENWWGGCSEQRWQNIKKECKRNIVACGGAGNLIPPVVRGAVLLMCWGSHIVAEVCSLSRHVLLVWKGTCLSETCSTLLWFHKSLWSATCQRLCIRGSSVSDNTPLLCAEGMGRPRCVRCGLQSILLGLLDFIHLLHCCGLAGVDHSCRGVFVLTERWALAVNLWTISSLHGTLLYIMCTIYTCILFAYVTLDIKHCSYFDEIESSFRSLENNIQ